MGLVVGSRIADGCAVLTVAGEVDVATAPQLRAELTDLIAAGNYHLVVDLDAVTFLDSTGLSAFVAALKRVRGHAGTIRLASPREPVERAFRVTGLTRVFPIYPTIGDALAATTR